MKMETIVDDFYQISMIAGITISPYTISIEILHAPHKPPSAIPVGKMAVYAFFWGDQCLKVGKVGAKSNARYISQHYNPKSSNSNLAKSILVHSADLGLNDINENNVGLWIKTNTDRVNFIIDENIGMSSLALLESFLQCRLKPRFEGFASQQA